MGRVFFPFQLSSCGAWKSAAEWKSIARVFKRNKGYRLCFSHGRFGVSPWRTSILKLQIPQTPLPACPQVWRWGGSHFCKAIPWQWAEHQSKYSQEVCPTFSTAPVWRGCPAEQSWQPVLLLVSLGWMMTDESAHTKQGNSSSDLDFPSIRAQRAIPCASWVNNRFWSVLVFHYLIKEINLIQYLPSRGIKPSPRKLNTHALTSVRGDTGRTGDCHCHSSDLSSPQSKEHKTGTRSYTCPCTMYRILMDLFIICNFLSLFISIFISIP